MHILSARTGFVSLNQILKVSHHTDLFFGLRYLRFVEPRNGIDSPFRCSSTSGRVRFISDAAPGEKSYTKYSRVGNAPVFDDDKWKVAIHPFQEPYWTGRRDPAEYLAHIQNVTLPKFRQTNRMRDLNFLRQAERIVWQLELMNKAYQDFMAATNDSTNSTVSTTTSAIAAENSGQSTAENSGDRIQATLLESTKAAAARRRYNDCRQEALEERMAFMRIRRTHSKSKDTYRFVMQNFPVPEPLADSDPN